MGPSAPMEATMSRRRENLAAAIVPHLAVGVLVWIGGVGTARAQPPAPPPAAAQSAGPSIPAEVPAPSQVFPDGGFPASQPAPEGGIPAPGATQTDLYPPLKPPAADYAPPGYEPRGIQQPPGVAEFFRLTPAPLPDYFYDPAYYQQPVVSPRTVEEYAPPGYEARDQQWGPGTPEFTPLTPPPPITPDEAAKFVSRGIMPGSFLVPGTNTSFRFRGFARLMGLYDFNPAGVPDAFVTNSIPAP